MSHPTPLPHPPRRAAALAGRQWQPAIPGMASLRAGPWPLKGLALALLAAAVPTLLLGALDPRTVDGLPWTANVWAKPLKFQLSMAVHLLTLAWSLGWMQRQGLAVPGRRLLVGALVPTVLFEAAYITVQGARGVRSHFNRATPLEDLGASLMASGAGVLVGAAAWVGAVALWHWWRQPAGQRAPMLVAIGLGFLATFLLAGITGSMLGQHRGPHVDMLAAQALPLAGLPLTGWRLDIGDLRIAHFMGVHAMQVLPMAAWLACLAWRQQRTPAQATVVAVTAAWCACTLGLMQWAAAGRGLL